MDEKIVKEILDSLFSSLEDLDARSTAALQFLKDKGLATSEELAPALKQAEAAASVRSRAARARIEYLLAGVMREEEKPSETKEEDETESSTDDQSKTSPPKEDEKAAPPLK